MDEAPGRGTVRLIERAAGSVQLQNRRTDQHVIASIRGGGQIEFRHFDDVGPVLQDPSAAIALLAQRVAKKLVGVGKGQLASDEGRDGRALVGWCGGDNGVEFGAAARDLRRSADPRLGRWHRVVLRQPCASPVDLGRQVCPVGEKAVQTCPWS